MASSIRLVIGRSSNSAGTSTSLRASTTPDEEKTFRISRSSQQRFCPWAISSSTDRLTSIWSGSNVAPSSKRKKASSQSNRLWIVSWALAAISFANSARVRMFNSTINSPSRFRVALRSSNRC